jgi:YqaJ-like viral recombinase domain
MHSQYQTFYRHRRGFIGGSDARIIMGNDEAPLIRLWCEKRGEIGPEDLSGNLIVQLGKVTEDLNRSWCQRNTGRTVADVHREVKHSAIPWMAATLDGSVAETEVLSVPVSPDQKFRWCVPSKMTHRINVESLRVRFEVNTQQSSESAVSLAALWPRRSRNWLTWKNPLPRRSNPGEQGRGHALSATRRSRLAPTTERLCCLPERWQLFERPPSYDVVEGGENA